MSIDEARKLGAMALFGEKYGETVRVVSVGDFDSPFDLEFCGGTHLKSSGLIGQFRIVSENGIASGTRRIEAVTGLKCYEMGIEDRKIIEEAAASAKVGKDQLVNKIASLHKEIKELQKSLADIEKAQVGNFAEEAVSKAEDIGGIKVVCAKTTGNDGAALRDTADKIRDNLKDGIVFLASEAGDKILFVAMATKSAVDKGAHCGNIIKAAAAVAGGGGGGRPDMAQAGGKDVSKIDDAIAKAAEIIKEQIGG